MVLNPPWLLVPILKNALPNLDDWLLTEATRLDEERHGRRVDDAAALEVARATDGGFEERLKVRARALPSAEALRADITRIRRLLARLSAGLLVFALLAGVMAASASLADRQVNILLAMTVLLALPTLMLLAWLVLMSWPGRGRSAGPTGSLLSALLAWLAPKLLRSDQAVELANAATGLLARPAGRWLLSAIAHLFWLVYALAAVLALVVYFSVVQYDLTWGTTLLADRSIVRAVEALAAAPAALGLIDPPALEWILAGRAGETTGEGRASWARFLIAMILVYGALPRALLAALSFGLARRGAGRLALDTGQPGYLRLAHHLADPEPEATVHGSVPEPDRRRTRQRPARARGRPVLVGIELERAEDDWPPRLPGIEVLALGRVDRRADRQAPLDAIAALDQTPVAVIALCSLLRTPDAGLARWLDSLADAAGTALVIVLEDAESLAGREISMAERWADWQATAERVGGEAVRLDRSGPDAAAVAHLRELCDPGAA